MKIKASVSRYKQSVQCFIPISLLRELGVSPGDKIEFQIRRGRLVGVPVKSKLFDTKIKYFVRND